MITDVGARLYARRKFTTSWGTPCWSDGDNNSGGITPAEGQILYRMVREQKPLNILEVGTSYGYSTLHLAQACKDNGSGHVRTVEIDGPRQNEAMKNIAEAGLMDWVSFYDEIPEYPHDFVFLDALHDYAGLRLYLMRGCRQAKHILIHDAAWQGYAEQVARDMRLTYEFIPTDSAYGLAVLKWIGGNG